MKEDITEQLNELKQALGLSSYEALAAEIGCSFSTLQGWLYRGIEPSPAYQRKINSLLERRD